MTDENEQNQTQTQSLVVNIQNSSDPALERKIFSEVASEGRQLGRISDVLGILIDAYEKNCPPPLEPGIVNSIRQFREMQAQIGMKKKEHSPERVIEALETMRREDNETYQLVAARLRKWLNEPPEASGGSTT
ncbi:MAG: hypothetical protein ABSB19_14550 [Methylomonas sp.]